MKLKNVIIGVMSSAILSGTASMAYAATKPSSITTFTPSARTAVLTAKKTAWRDPAFGNEGWTHSSGWGTFTTKGIKTIRIDLNTSVVGLHPGITVWYRGADDTAPDNWVPDHFYSQNANFVEFGAKDESTGTILGNISMQNVAFNYDQDGNFDAASGKLAKPFGFFKGVLDRVPGKLSISFLAARPGTYMFVVGGFNADKLLTGTAKFPISVTVSGN